MSWTVHWITSVGLLTLGVKRLNIRKVDRHYNLCFLLPKTIRCGEHYIKVRRPTPGLMGPGSLLHGSIWFGPPLSSKTTFKECEYHPSFFSDHSYLLVKFELEQDFRGPGVWNFNNSLLDDPEYCDLVASFWSFWQRREGSEWYSSLLDWWDQGKYYLREVTRTFSKAKVERSRKSSLTRQMHNLQCLFEAGDSSAFPQLCQVQEDLRVIALHEARGAQTRARCQWTEEGESSSSYFFGLEAKHQARQKVSSIRDPISGQVGLS